MSAEPYIGEIFMFCGNFAPSGFAFCDGQRLPISQNDALFGLIGTKYGGDWQQTFALPDLRGRLPIHQGQGPGLRSFKIGESGGVEKAYLNEASIPSHSHKVLQVVSTAGNQQSPAGAFFAADAAGVSAPFSTEQPSAPMRAGLVRPSSGGNLPHPNLMPALCVNFIIALTGIFPTSG
jgi:microcystin-dependent protein